MTERPYVSRYSPAQQVLRRELAALEKELGRPLPAPASQSARTVAEALALVAFIREMAEAEEI